MRVVGVRRGLAASVVDTVGALCKRSMPKGVMRLRGAGGRFRKRLALIIFPFLGVSGGKPRRATRRVNKCLGRRTPRLISTCGTIGNFLGLAVTSSY